jgi:hypothetical protein
VRRLQERSEKLAAAWRAAAAPLAACEDFLKNGLPSGVVLQDHETEPPKLGKNESLLDAVENRRRRVRELRADAHRIASAQFPADYTKAKMRRQISQLAEQGQPSVASLVELDGNVEFPTIRQQATVVGAQERSLAFSEQPDATALICWLFQDELVKRLDAEIDAETDGSALSHEQRELRTTEIMSDLLDVERDESFFVWEAQARGLPYEHRSDISPLALLGLRLVTIPRANEAPETTPGYSWPMRR